MKIEKLDKILSIILAILWMGVIYSFSNQNGDESQNLSDKFTIKLVNTKSKITKKEYSKKEKQDIVNKYSFIIRKTAHFTVYLILGLLVYNMLYKFNLNKMMIISIIICVLYATSDEVHQYFISERAFRILDILIDTCGSIIGILLGGKIYEKVFEFKKHKFNN